MIHYSDLSLRSKITIVMESLMVLLCIVLCFSIIIFFSNGYEKEANKLADQWTNVIVVNINQTWTDIYDKVLRSTTDYQFSNVVSNPDLTTIDKKVALQSDITSILSSSSIVENVYFLSDKDEILCSFDDFFINQDLLLRVDDLKDIQGISVLPEMKSPFRRTGHVVPIIIPFSNINNSSYVGIAQSGTTDVYLVILVSAEKMRAGFQEITSKEMSIDVQFYFNGMPILNDVDLNVSSDYISTRKDCMIEGLDIQVDLNKETLFTGKDSVIAFSIISTVIIVIISGLLISLIAKRLMSPFANISRMLDQMKDGSYKFDVKPRYHDESGILIESLNDMYGQLMDNLEKIKYEEKQKFLYMSQMLTEQINPHFIYNTLEIINMEIIAGNIATASEMVSSFSSFLRYSLNKGDFMIKLSDEIKQAETYMKIMNFRLNGIISFSISCPDAIQGIEIPKLILQPLVENSIKHGFDSLSHGGFIDPRISILISCTENILTINVSDNGQGIDIEKAEKAMNKESDKKSFGLNNIATRLRIFDGACKIEFRSIPYFNNEVVITLHLPS